jgi:hypothetical protein
MRLLGATLFDIARALARPILCSALLAAALTVLLGATDSFSPITSLLILVGAGVLVFAGAVAIFARSLITPMWVSIRETRS